MSDIAGPPAPKELPSQIRGADKTAHVSKDPNSTNTPSGDQPREQTARDQGQTQTSRDPAVSIASTAAHLVPGQEIKETVSKIDAEGRPIIVTNTVTLALKPAAELQPNDAVHLKIIDAGRHVTADLVQQNSVKIDPPVRLSVTVIEVHISNKTQEKPNPLQPAAKLDAPYQSPKTAVSSSTPKTPIQPSDLSAFIGRNTNLPPNATNTPQAHTSATTSSASITSSADLATLIQQQSATASEKPAPPPIAGGTSPLAASGPGIGPALNSVAINGAPAVIQLLDTSISTVRPADVATVQNVQTFTATEARGLPIGASEVIASGASGELVKLETSRGDFILKAADAVSLGGELVRVSVGTAPNTSAASDSSQQASPSFRALLIESKPGAVPSQITISFLGQSQDTHNTAGNIAAITSVKTASAFFGANGPKTDLRLQTSHGDISVTVPSGIKPQIGDRLIVLIAEHSEKPATTLSSTPNSAAQPGGPIETSGLLSSSPAHPANTAMSPNLLASWPAMEESLAALLGTNHAAAASLIAKTAQGGSKLINSLLFFLKAAGMGSSGNWIGNDVEKALARSSQASLGNLRADIGQMTSLAGETIGEWRPIVLPFDARSGEVPLAALLLGQRQDIDPNSQQKKPNSGEQDKEKGQRFILQVQFSVLGDIQLDGNINQHVFDLTVRSKQGLPSNLQRDSAELFHASLAANGFAGSINFLQQNQFSVDAAALIENHIRGDQPTSPAD